MAEAEFGIIDNIMQDEDYSEYEPDKYGCIGTARSFIGIDRKGNQRE